MRRTLTALTLASLAGLSTSATAAAAPFASAIFAEVGPKAVVPGLPNNLFTAFDRPYRSLNGQHWIITAIINTGAAATDEVVLVGSGTTGTLVAQEGVTLINGLVIRSGSIDQTASINDSGAYAFAANFDLVPSISGSLVADAIVTGDPMNPPTRALRSFDPVPSLTDIGWGTTISSIGISNTGNLSARTTFLRGINGASNPATTVDSGLFRNSGAIMDAREGDAGTAPSGQDGGGTLTWQNFRAEDYTVDASGNNWFAIGDLAGTVNDDVAVYNNVVVLQEGIDSTGLGSNIATGTTGIRSGSILPNGQWWAYGSNVDGNDWVILGDNAVTKSVIAQRGDEIFPGAGESWSDSIFAQTFFAFAADNDGNYVVGGVTDNADVARNAVLVYNGLSVILREGDQVDIDGNGILDDDAFISVFNNDDLFLAGDMLYFTADLVNAAGGSLGQAYMVVRVPAPSALGLLGLSALVGLRRRR
ncbi:MAG: hypothetical protein KF768_01255 [Phycisphaeraceae bacterium]|nr:hypothetical protein [Phycisphaeraceae bacterium]